MTGFTDTLSNRKPLFIALALTVGLGLFLFLNADRPAQSVVWASSEQLTTMLPLGEEGPDFALTTPAGETVRLASLRGQRVALAFVPPGCSFCKKLNGRLQTLEPSPGRQVLIVSKGSPAEVQAVDEAFSLGFPILIDSTGAVHQAYKITGVPHVYLLDEAGKIETVRMGWPGSWELIQRQL